MDLVADAARLRWALVTTAVEVVRPAVPLGHQQAPGVSETIEPGRQLQAEQAEEPVVPQPGWAHRGPRPRCNDEGAHVWQPNISRWWRYQLLWNTSPGSYRRFAARNSLIRG